MRTTKGTTMELQELVQAVKAHAKENYNAGGWDVIVECYEDEQIAEKLTEDKATTVSEAITSFQWMVDVWADRQADARISAGCNCISHSCRHLTDVCYYRYSTDGARLSPVAEQLGD